MARATFWLHGALRALGPRPREDAGVGRPIAPGQTVKDAVEALGVPHTEVELILADGRPVGFDHLVGNGERIDVHGVDRPPELAHLPGLAPARPAPPRFVVDGHLGRLARYLRMLGFDTLYDPRAADDALAQTAANELRILLTRDRGLLKRSIVAHGHLVGDDEPRRQLADVVERFRLREQVAAFSRCIRCNGRIEPVDRAAVLEILAGEPRTLASFDAFGRCAECGAVYWQGSHFERMSELVRGVLGGSGPGGRERAGSG